MMAGPIAMIICSSIEKRPGEIAIHTRRGRHIENDRSFEVTTVEQQKDSFWREKFKGRATFRTGPSPIYNCHGLTFASRRTRIPDVTEVLADDGYQELPLKDVLPGD